MYLISICSIFLLAIMVIVSSLAFTLGAGTLAFLCLAAAVCIILGAGLLIKLLAKGIFSLLKCIIFVIFLAIPGINVITLAVIGASMLKSVFT